MAVKHQQISHMKYKLLVLDVDGTLVNSKKELSEQTLTALLKVQHMGLRIVLASGGRPAYGLRHLIEKLELKKWGGGYILSYNGGQIIDVGNDKVIFEKKNRPVNDSLSGKESSEERFWYLYLS